MNLNREYFLIYYDKFRMAESHTSADYLLIKMVPCRDIFAVDFGDICAWFFSSAIMICKWYIAHKYILLYLNGWCCILVCLSSYIKYINYLTDLLLAWCHHKRFNFFSDQIPLNICRRHPVGYTIWLFLGLSV